MGIPKRCFLYFTAPRMSWLRYLTLASLCRHNPDWTIELYTSPDNSCRENTWSDKDPMQQDHATYTGPDYWPLVDDLPVVRKTWDTREQFRQSPPSQKSNLFKWFHLGYPGGVYSDMDILYTAPLPTWDAKTVLCVHGNCFAIGLLASSCHNRFFFEVYNNATRCIDPMSYQSAGVQAMYRLLGTEDSKPGLIEKVEKIGQPVLNIPRKLVYPFWWNELEHYWEREHRELPAETIGLHWYAGAPVSQEWNNRIDHETITQFENTIAYHAEQYS